MAAEKIVVLGVGGRMGTGKSTLCAKVRNIISFTRPGWEACNMTFGGCVRTYIGNRTAIRDHHLIENEYKNVPLSQLGYTVKNARLGGLGDLPVNVSLTVRELLQTVGQGKRDVDPDFWVKTWLQEVRYVINHSPNNIFLTVDDIRYFNEVSIVRNGLALILPGKGCTASYTVRLATPRHAPNDKVLYSAHLSENNFDEQVNGRSGKVMRTFPETTTMFHEELETTWGGMERTAYSIAHKLMETYILPY